MCRIEPRFLIVFYSIVFLFSFFLHIYDFKSEFFDFRGETYTIGHNFNIFPRVSNCLGPCKNILYIAPIFTYPYTIVGLATMEIDNIRLFYNICSFLFKIRLVIRNSAPLQSGFSSMFDHTRKKI